MYYQRRHVKEQLRNYETRTTRFVLQRRLVQLVQHVELLQRRHVKIVQHVQLLQRRLVILLQLQRRLVEVELQDQMKRSPGILARLCVMLTRHQKTQKAPSVRN